MKVFSLQLVFFFVLVEAFQQTVNVQRWQQGVNRKVGRSLNIEFKTSLQSMIPNKQEENTVKSSKNSGNVEEYRNAVTGILSNFMQKDKMADKENGATDPISKIDFQAPKISPSTSLETLAQALDYELTEKEWFVTGNVNPSYFSDDFKFQDPDVKVNGIEDYSKGVYKLFDQATSRAEIISTVVNEDVSTPEKPIITCTWRLSGGVSIGFGLQIKPYIVYTDFTIDPKTSLIVFQEDRFDLPSWDILLRCV